MAQHDYVIDNSTGANVRADINSVLQAIASNNSGSSAPSTTYALQSFANTTDSMLQLRNAANNAFVNLRKFDGTLPLPDGSVSSPSLFFDDDTNTGIFSSAADTLNFTTGGVERMELGATTVFNEDGADVDFRIEGDTNANLFYVDAGNNRIGIGHASPTRPLHIVSDEDLTSFTGTTKGAFCISNSDFASGEYSAIDFTYTGSDNPIGRIATKITNSGTLLSFGTSNDFGNGISNEALVIDFNGQVIISGTTEAFDTTGIVNGLQLYYETDQGIATIGSYSSGGSSALNFHTNSGGGASEERFRVTSAGKVLVNTTDGSGLGSRFVINSTVSDVFGIRFSSEANDGLSMVIKGFVSGTPSGTCSYIQFQRNDSGVRGSITANGATDLAFNETSDYRLKENVVAISDGITRLKTLKPSRFNWKEDTNRTVDGFLAHEVSTAIPEAVTGTKDAVDENGEIIVQQLDKSKIIPLLTAALQEAITKIEVLETKVAALEAA